MNRRPAIYGAILALSLWVLGFGLWTHDWRCIVGSAAVLVIVPLIDL